MTLRRDKGYSFRQNIKCCIFTYLIPPLSPCRVLLLYSASRTHSGPGHCAKGNQMSDTSSSHLDTKFLFLKSITVPARLHKSWETLEKARISFLFQVTKHFLGESIRIFVSKIYMLHRTETVCLVHTAQYQRVLWQICIRILHTEF